MSEGWQLFIVGVLVAAIAGLLTRIFNGIERHLNEQDERLDRVEEALRDLGNIVGVRRWKDDGR